MQVCLTSERPKNRFLGVPKLSKTVPDLAGSSGGVQTSGPPEGVRTPCRPLFRPLFDQKVDPLKPQNHQFLPIK